MPMNHFIGHHQVVAYDDALELALELWLGPDEETDEERSARLDAGRDILAEDPELFDRAVRAVTQVLATSGRATPPRVHLLPSHSDGVDMGEATAA